MLQFKNSTPFTGTIYLIPDAEGVDTLFAIVKASFMLGERLTLADEQVPVTLADTYYGEPGKSSIKAPSDVGLSKPATDVLLVGSAYASRGRPTSQMDVSLAAGPVRKHVRVIGDRAWHKGSVGSSISSPVPFDRMPLVWDRAFGGTDTVDGKALAEARNPVGIGYRGRKGERPLDGLRLPNLEDPEHLVGSWKDTPPPACFAPICAHWEPRKSFAGTYDEEWQKRRAPYLPTDFDPRFCQVAPPGLVAPGYLDAGAVIEVRGATPAGVLRFQLPPMRIEITYLLDNMPRGRPASLDTVLIQPDENRLVLVWRAALRCDKRALRVNEVRPSVLKAA